MASTSTEQPPQPPPNWLELPPELTSSILQRLTPVEILNSTQTVCLTWRQICKDPSMWKVINITKPDDAWDADHDLVNLTKQAVHRSSGELVDISLDSFCTDELLHHISQRSSKLQTISLTNCYNITSRGLSHAVKNLTQLENLHLYYISIHVEDIEIIGNNCPNLKSFKLSKEFRRPHIECDGDAIAIANTMPELRHLQLFGNKMTNDGLQAILHNCPHLESLDVRRCFNLNLSGSLAKLCKEQIKDFKRPNDSTENCGFNPQFHGYGDFDDMYSSGYSDVNDYSEDEFYEDYDFSDGSAVSDYDYFDL